MSLTDPMPAPGVQVVDPSPLVLSAGLSAGVPVVYLDPQRGQLYTSQTACVPWETLSGAWWVRLEGLAEAVPLCSLFSLPRPIAARAADEQRCPPLSSVYAGLSGPVRLPF